MNDRPHVAFDPAYRWGYAQINGISTEAIADHYWAGETIEDIAADYDLTPHQVLIALWYEGRHGQYRKQWAGWVETAEPQLAAKTVDVASMPLPTQRDGAPA